MSLHHLLMMSYGAGVVSAFPTLEGTATTGLNSQGTPRNANLPSGISSGELLMIFLSVSLGSINWPPSGWTSLTSAGSGTNNFYVAYKTASGSEGTTVSITWASGNRNFSSVALRISGFTGTPSAGSPTTNTNTGTTDIDPPNLDTGVSAKYLWIAAGSFQTGRTPSAAPTNYTNRSGESTALGTRNLEASQENPGTFTTDTSTLGFANTYAVKGT